MNGALRVIGIDVSLTATGMSDGRSTWQVRSKGSKDATLAHRLDRIADVSTEILAAVWRTEARLVVIEQPAYASQTGHMHDRSGLWWLVVAGLADMPGAAVSRPGPLVAEVPPTTVKKYTTGRGNAGKDEMLVAATRRFPWFDGGNDEADALWLAAMGYDHLGCPLLPMPAVNRKQLDAVRWPQVTR